MKKRKIAVGFIGGLALLTLASGCLARRVARRQAYIAARTPTVHVVHVHSAPAIQAEAEDAEIVVHEAPPEPIVQVISVAPGADHTWTPGYWAWRGGWVWEPGRWVVRPHARAVWSNGAWVRRGSGYVWVRGRWR